MTIQKGTNDDQTDHDASLDPRLLTDLHAAYRRSPPLHAVDGAIRCAVEARVAQQAAPERRVRRRRLLPRLSVPVAALAALALGLGSYFHGQSPTPVSAQTVLHSAAVAGPGANEAIHAIYRISSSDGATGTADVWVGYNASGAAHDLELTVTMLQNGHSTTDGTGGLTVSGSGAVGIAPRVDGQAPSVDGQAAQVPASGTTRQPGTPPTSAPISPARTLKGIVVGTLLAEKLSNQPGSYTLRQQTLDGVSVYALQPAGADTTFYFNGQSYALQGADWVQDGTSWQARLDSSSTVPLSAVPPHTFQSGTAAHQRQNEPQSR